MKSDTPRPMKSDSKELRIGRSNEVIHVPDYIHARLIHSVSVTPLCTSSNIVNLDLLSCSAIESFWSSMLEVGIRWISVSAYSNTIVQLYCINFAVNQHSLFLQPRTLVSHTVQSTYAGYLNLRRFIIHPDSVNSRQNEREYKRQAKNKKDE